jgi:hypothetical protein
VLSTTIATAGVIGDSTATVIGAMIIAPLATPIQGVAAAIAYGEHGRRHPVGARNDERLVLVRVDGDTLLVTVEGLTDG